MLLNLVKTFDYVKHQILQDKLEHLDVRENAYKLLNSYLPNHF